MVRGNSTLIYADTSIWNCLCDQNVDPSAFLTALAARDAELVLGENVVSELAKTFDMSNDNAQIRAKQLFSTLRPYVQLRIPALKPTWALLIEEALHVCEERPRVEPFASDCTALASAVDELSEGTVGPGARKIIRERRAVARSTRSAMNAHLKARPKLTNILRQATLNKNWLVRQATGFRGRAALAGHLAEEFPSNSAAELVLVAKKLLAKRRYRVSQALARSDVYLNWRCANHGSLRSDVPDDIFHVVNASYCNVFVTTDRDQASYASDVLDGVESFVYDRSESLFGWLLSLDYQ